MDKITLPPDLMKRIEEMAEKYRYEDFKKNPDGYTVATYCNSETTSTAFEAGAQAMYAELAPRLEHKDQIEGNLLNLDQYSGLLKEENRRLREENEGLMVFLKTAHDLLQKERTKNTELANLKSLLAEAERALEFTIRQSGTSTDYNLRCRETLAKIRSGK